MKFTINAVPLADAAQYASKAISKRPVSPAMGGILIAVNAGTVTLTGSDYDAAASATIEADTEAHGEVLIHAGMLTDIARKMKGRNVTIEGAGRLVTIAAGSSRYALPRMERVDYPDVTALPGLAGHVDGQSLGDAIARAAGAVLSTGELPVLEGILLRVEGDRLTIHATDRYRLAEEVIDYNGREFTALLNAGFLQSASKALMGSVALHADENRFGISAANRESSTTIMGGDFPKIGKLFPDETPTVAAFDRAELMDALDRATIVVERGRAVAIDITKDGATITAGDDGRTGSESVSATASEPHELVFNPDFLQWALKNTPSETVRLGMIAPGKPTLVSDPTGAYVGRKLVMPVRKS